MSAKAAPHHSRLVFTPADREFLAAVQTNAASWRFFLDPDDDFELLSIVPPGSPSGDAVFLIVPAAGGGYVKSVFGGAPGDEEHFATLKAAWESIKPS